MWQFCETVSSGSVLIRDRAGKEHSFVGNFTTVVDRLRRQGVRHVLLVTSGDHMQRALLVGRLVAGSRGIHLTPMAVPCGSKCRPEPFGKVWGDGLRALVWVLSGLDLRQEMQNRPAER